MRTISSDVLVYEQSPANEPVDTIQSGETFRIATRDCYSDRYYYEDQDPVHYQPGYRTNPTTGPLRVTGAMPGDLLKIEILAIEFKDNSPIPGQRIPEAFDLGEHSTMVLRPGMALLGDEIDDLDIKIIPIRDGKLLFSPKVSVDLTPMVGFIAVAPKDEVIENSHPGLHGGNMDCTLVKAGAVLYLPVQVEDALLSVGDVHAAMADGEICICGAESPGYVTLKVTIIKNPLKLPVPFLISGGVVCAINTQDTLDQAAAAATREMHDFLCGIVGMAKYDSIRLLSLVGNVRICQCIGKYKTARMEFPLSILEKYGYVPV